MPNANKAKGGWAERALKAAFRRNGFASCEVTRAGYTRDYGDLHLLATRQLICQMKNVRVPIWSKWMLQLKEQKENAGAETAFLVWKPSGLGEVKIGEWLAVMQVRDFAELLRRAGYGDPLDGKTREIADDDGIVK